MASYFIQCVKYNLLLSFLAFSPPVTFAYIKRVLATFWPRSPVFIKTVLHSSAGDGCYLSFCYPSAYRYDLFMKQKLSEYETMCYWTITQLPSHTVSPGFTLAAIFTYYMGTSVVCSNIQIQCILVHKVKLQVVQSHRVS